MTDIVATTDRLILRQWRDGDDDAFYARMNRPDVMRWLGGVQDRAAWDAAHQRILGFQRDHGFTFWIVEPREGGDILGFCGLKRVNAPGAAMPGMMEIGWRFHPEVWGQGIAREAAEAVMALGFTRFAAPEMVAITVAGNRPSQKLMERLGMERAQRFDFTDTRFPAGGELNPMLVWHIDAPRWRARSAAGVDQGNGGGAPLA